MKTEEQFEAEFHIIKEPKLYLGKKVHVDTWDIGCVFILSDTDGLSHTLITPKTRKTYKTTNKLRELRGGS